MGRLSTRIVNFVVLFAVLTPLPAGPAQSGVIDRHKNLSKMQVGRTTPTSLCQEGEAIIAACPIGKKLISVCSKGTVATYRYGQPYHIEIEAAGLYHAQNMFAGGGEDQIWFDRQNFRYVLYDALISGGYDHEGHTIHSQKMGIFIQKKGKILSDKSCQNLGGPFINSSLASQKINHGEYISH